MGRLYAGLGPALILTINPGLEFMLVETLRDFYRSKFSQQPTSSIIFIISAIAKIGATVLTYPSILAKVKMQNSGESNLFHVLKEIFKAGGFTAFYAGLQIQLFKAVLFASIRNTAKEKIERFLKTDK